MTNFYFNRNTLDQSYLRVTEGTTGHRYTGLEKCKLLHEQILRSMDNFNSILNFQCRINSDHEVLNYSSSEANPDRNTPRY